MILPNLPNLPTPPPLPPEAGPHDNIGSTALKVGLGFLVLALASEGLRAMLSAIRTARARTIETLRDAVRKGLRHS